MPYPDPFALPDRLAAKRAGALIDADRIRFAEIAETLRRQRERLTARRDELRRAPAGYGQLAMERDEEIRRLSAHLRLLDRFGLDLCLGRMTPAGGDDHIYIGRTGLAAEDGTRLLVDWRAPAAEPFFAATLEDPMGLSSRRRYRWSDSRVSDYWDEALIPDALAGAALDDQSAFIASLGAQRSSRMRDVLATIQSDQDAIIRAESHGALVVDGGPGTGKTVVALHRAARLLYAEPRLTAGGGGMLFVGPNRAYLSYVDDVLPSLGEESVRMCTLRDLVEEGADAGEEPDPAVSALKATMDPVAVVEEAVRGRIRPPAHAVRIESPWGDLYLGRAEWAEAFDLEASDLPVNEARDEAWERVLEILGDQRDDPDVPPHVVHRWLRQDDELTGLFVRAWRMLDPADLIAELWSSPESLRSCVPQLSAAAIALLQRSAPRDWTVDDLPFLDAARRRIGDPDAARNRRRREAERAATRERMSHVVDQLIESDQSEMRIMSMLRGEDTQAVLDEADAVPVEDPDVLAGPFGHIIVDEAQELTDAQWRMLLQRCPSRSLTIVGDRAQARRGFPEEWAERLSRVGLREVRLASLAVNYRTPEEVMAAAAPVIRAAIPDANVPTSVRSSGIPVRYGAVPERDGIVQDWLSTREDGVACVIGDPSFRSIPRVRSLTPEAAKGLEFDLVIVVSPDRFGTGITGAVDRYVAMTRATERLVVLR